MSEIKNLNEWKKELSFVILFFIVIWGSGLYMYLEGERVPNLSILICGFIGYNKVSGTIAKNLINSKKNILNEWSFVINKKIYSWNKWILNMKKFLVILAWNNIITQNWKKTLLNKNLNNKNINFLENLDVNLINSLISKKLYIIIMYEILQKKLYHKYNVWNIITKKNKLLSIILNNNLINTINLDIIFLKLNLKK